MFLIKGMVACCSISIFCRLLSDHICQIILNSYELLFDLILYIPVNIFSIMLGRVFLG